MANVHRAMLPLLALASLAVQGCGGRDFETVCREQEDCLGGNEKDVEACIARLESDAAQGDVIGCTDEFDAHFACITPELKCIDEPTGIPCNTGAECSSAFTRCVGGECMTKYYALDPNSQNTVCEAESNAYSHCH